MNEMQAASPSDSRAPWLSLGALLGWTKGSTALRLRNRGWYPFIFLICFIVPVVAWFRFAATRSPELLISVLGGVSGFFYFLYRRHLDETKLFNELFPTFNRRYDDLKDNLNGILFDPSEGVLSPVQREKVFNYFNLCAEEYFFYKAGYIDRDVWKSWYRGMELFFRHPRIQWLWDQESKESYYGFQPPK